MQYEQICRNTVYLSETQLNGLLVFL